MGYGNHTVDVAIPESPDTVFAHLKAVLAAFRYQTENTDEKKRAIVAVRNALFAWPWRQGFGRIAARVDGADEGGTIMRIESGPLYAPTGPFDTAYHRRAVNRILEALGLSLAAN